VLQALIGLAAIALLPYLGNLPMRMAAVPHEHYGDLLRTECGIIAVVVFIPTLLIGAVFPFTFRMASGSDRAVGRSVAAVYTWNTIGSIAGSLAASFALIPTLGLAVSLRLAATVNLAVAALLLVRGAPRLRPSAAAPALLALVVWLLPSWNEQVLASGAYLYGAEYAAA